MSNSPRREQRKAEIRTLIEAGRQAFKDGKSMHSNPSKPSHPDYTHWAQGYEEAKTEDERDNSPQVHLVMDCYNAPGRVLACFADKSDADKFLDALEHSAERVSRRLWYGQPPVRGLND